MPTVTSLNSPSPPPPGAASAAARRDGARAWQDGAFSFGDILDAVNPLQHIPFVNMIYRAVTGDTIGAAPKIAGGTLFGGVIGLVAALVDTAVEEATGKDAGAHALALLEPESEDAPVVATQVAAVDFADREDDEISRFMARSARLAAHEAEAPAQLAAATIARAIAGYGGAPRP